MGAYVTRNGKRYYKADNGLLYQDYAAAVRAQQKNESPVAGLTRMAGSLWSQADRALGGWLPGGGTANPLSPTVRSAASAVSQAPRQLRDVVLDRVPRPESLFFKALTGGAPTQTTMTDREVAAIKGAWEEKNRPIPSAEQLHREEMDAWNKQFGPGSSWPESAEPPPKPTLQHAQQSVLSSRRAQESPVTSLYGHDRDVKLAYGKLSVYPQPDGGVRIYDYYKVDPSEGETTAVEKDLTEGGKIPTALFRAARRLGTYKPFEIDVTVSPERWNRIQATPPRTRGPQEGSLLDDAYDQQTRRDQGPVLYQLNKMFGGFFGD